MNNLQRVSAPLGQAWRALPVPARVVSGIVAVFVVIYIWQILLGLLFMAAFFIGLYQIARWFFKR